MRAQANNVVIGFVAEIGDPEELGRVRVTLPYFDNQMSSWARVATPMAGRERGFFFRPEIGDEVVVAFLDGDPRDPVVVGALWNKNDKPPPDDGEPADNNRRFIVSRSGHVLIFDDTDGAEKIEIVDQSGALHAVLDSATNKIELTAAAGDVEVSAPAGTVKIEAKTIELRATGNVDIEAGAVMTITGATVNTD